MDVVSFFCGSLAQYCFDFCGFDFFDESDALVLRLDEVVVVAGGPEVRVGALVNLLDRDLFGFDVGEGVVAVEAENVGGFFCFVCEADFFVEEVVDDVPSVCVVPDADGCFEVGHVDDVDVVFIVWVIVLGELEAQLGDVLSVESVEVNGAIEADREERFGDLVDCFLEVVHGGLCEN